MGLRTRILSFIRGDHLLPAAAGAAPALPPRRDSSAEAGGGGWVNASTGLGTARDPAYGTTYGYQVQLPDDLRRNLYLFEPTTRIVVDRPGKDLVRRGVTLKGFEGYDQQPLESSLQDLQVMRKIGLAYRWMRKDGGAALFLVVDDGRTHNQPIDWRGVKRLHTIHVLERWQVTPAQWQWDPSLPYFGEPLYYYVHTQGSRGSLNLIHRDRLIPFVSGDLSIRDRTLCSGWGVSEIDRIWNALRAKGHALANVSTILSSFAVDVVKINGFHAMVKNGEKAALQERADRMRSTVGTLSKIFLDTTEDMVPLTRSIAGLADVVSLQIDELQASTWIPKSILRGQSPGGLGDGENAGEVRGYYDFIGGEQEDYLVPAFCYILRLLLCARFGPTAGEEPDVWSVEPKPLWTPSDAERAAIRLQHAQARSTDWMTGQLTPAQFGSDPTLAEFYDLDADEEGGLDIAGEDDEARPFPANETPMTTGEAAAHFGVGPNSIRTMIKSGAINSYQVNGRYVVSLQEIMRATTTKRAQIDPPVAEAA